MGRSDINYNRSQILTNLKLKKNHNKSWKIVRDARLKYTDTICQFQVLYGFAESHTDSPSQSVNWTKINSLSRS